MSRIPTKLIVVAATSAIAAGGAGAIVDAGAAKPAHKAKTAHAKKSGKRRGAARLLGRAVHADLTVPTKDGFKDVTVDRGFLTSDSGDSLTINESTKKLTGGKTVTVSVPSDAKVRLDKKAAQLSDLKPGQHVAVFHLPKKTLVRAFSAK